MSIGLSREEVARYWVGIDAITAIVSNPIQRQQLWKDLDDIWQALRQDGNRIRPFKLHSYSGHGCGPLRIGDDGVGTIVQCTGELSQTMATLLADYDIRATRLDIQATFELKEPRPDWAIRLYAYWEEQRQAGIHSRVNKLIQSTTGATAYTGSRKGERTIRVYDKSAQLNAEPGKFWRTEVEFHADKATGYWAGWQAATDDKAWLEAVIMAVFNGIHVELPISTEISGSAMATPGNLRSTERYLKWFQTSVAPVVRDLHNKVDQGTLLEALGLQQALPLASGSEDNEDGSR